MDATLCQDAPLTVAWWARPHRRQLRRAYHEAGARVLAFDIDEDILDAARVDVVQAPLDDAGIPSCDLIILAAYPEGVARVAARPRRRARRASDAASLAGPVVIDTAGVKRGVCDEAFALAAERGILFVGTHPMAGTEHSGFAHARADLFAGRRWCSCRRRSPTSSGSCSSTTCTGLLAPAGFGSFSVTTPEEHDRVIAFTSQLAHVVSNAYVKSPTARMHHGFSAGELPRPHARGAPEPRHVGRAHVPQTPTTWCARSRASSTRSAPTAMPSPQATATPEGASGGGRPHQALPRRRRRPIGRQPWTTS